MRSLRVSYSTSTTICTNTPFQSVRSLYQGNPFKGDPCLSLKACLILRAESLPWVETEARPGLDRAPLLLLPLEADFEVSVGLSILAGSGRVGGQGVARRV